MHCCAATVHSKRFCLAISEVKGRALAIVAAWPVVERWNYIINGLCVTVNRAGVP